MMLRRYSTGPAGVRNIVDRVQHAVDAARKHPGVRKRVPRTKDQEPFAQSSLHGTGLVTKIQHNRNNRRRNSPTRDFRPTEDHGLHRNYKYRIESVGLSYEPLEVPNQAEVPRLANDLDRTLFSPGVHYLKDPRTNVYNFNMDLENIMSIRDFDFSAIPPFVPSGKDSKLSVLAMEHKKKYTGSTSSMTPLLTQIHFMLSHHRPPHLMSMSKFFPETTTTFSSAQRSPINSYLRFNKKTKTWSINSSGGIDDSEMILSLLGQTMETMLVTDTETFKNYDKKRSHLLDETLKSPQSTYNYTTSGPFLMRSQLDCYDPRLPGTGMFDLKTRAVCAIRHDIDYAQIHDGSNYQLLKLDGGYESYSREFHGLIRSALFKYSLQARIGRMDGIFVAFHNIRTLFGFQYLPLSEIDKIFHTSHLIYLQKNNPDMDLDQEMSRVGPIIADTEFKLSIKIMGELFDAIIAASPEASREEAFNLIAHSASPGDLIVFAKPMRDNDIFNSTSSVKNITHDLDYKSCEDPYTLPQHYAADPNWLPPDVLAFRVTCESKINGKRVVHSKYPAMENSTDNWTVDFDITKLLRSEAEEIYQKTMSQRIQQEITSSPLKEHPEDEESFREMALEKLPSPTSFQEMLRKLDQKGKMYKEWDITREKTQWHPTKAD